MLTDSISDFLTRLRNASRAGKHIVTAPASKMLKAIAQVLANKQFIKAFSEEKAEGSKFGYIMITLRTDRPPLELKRISKPGQRIYVGHKNIKRVKSGLGIGLISTSKGILTDKESREQKIGGEYICEIY